MKKILLFLQVLIIFPVYLFGQSSSYPELPRTVQEFKRMLNVGFYRFNVPYNSGQYEFVFDQNETIHLPIGLRFFFLEPDGISTEVNQTSVTIENVTFTGDNNYSIEFVMDHPVIFQVRNSRFMNTGRLWFRHGPEELMHLDDQQSYIALDGNYIENTNYRQEPYYSAVLFQRFRGMDDAVPQPVAINNIIFTNNHINIKRDAEAANYIDDDFYIKRTFTSGLHFSRTTNRDYINNVRVENNLIEANNAPGFDTPVWAFNLENRGFTGSDNTNYLYDHLFELNKGFKLNNNTFLTQSMYQSGAVFFVGPFTGLEFKNNVVKGFKRYQIHNCPEPDDSLCEDYRWGTEARPVVVFYGARITQNVNNIRDVVVEANTIRTGSSGFRLNGMVNGLIRNNTIYMNEEIELPPYYNGRNYRPISDRSAIIVSTGHAWDAKYKSRNITIDSNTIYGNNHDNVAGIRLFHGTDLTVTNNKIYDISSYGIHHESSVTWAEEPSVGDIVITDNYVTTTRYFSEMSTNRKLYFSYLDSYEHLKLDRHIPPAMISFSRLVQLHEMDQIQNEKIIITNNTLKKRDAHTLPVFFENGVILENGRHRSFSDYEPAVFERNTYVLKPNYYNEFKNLGIWSGAGLSDGKWVIGDFNGDGISDILRTVSPDRGAEIWFGGNGSFSSNHAGVWSDDYNFGNWYTGRFTRTDRDEIMSYEPKSNGSGIVRIYTPHFNQNNATWQFNKAIEITVQGEMYQNWNIGDFNGDGYSDLLQATSAKGGARVFINSGDGTFVNTGIWLDDSFNNFGKWYTGDFNGDGSTDLLGRMNELGGAYVFYANTEARQFDDPRILNQAGIQGDWVIGDFSGDGHADALRPRFTDKQGNLYEMRIWFGLNMDKPQNDREYYDGEIWNVDSVHFDWYTGNFLNNGRTDLMTFMNEYGGALVFGNNQVKPEPYFIDPVLPETTKKTDVHHTETPGEFTLLQNYPNPFNPVTTITYTLPGDGTVQLSVYSISGQRVMQLVSEYKNRGTHSVILDGSRLASGVYMYRLQFGQEVRTRKFMLIK
ncbi:MAG: T9SS type A sorting domain-containing protein [Cyclonatronaceae bacterium]